MYPRDPVAVVLLVVSVVSRGVDVSSYQGVIDFDALRPAVDFVIVKATEGSGFIDTQFVRNWSEAKRVGLRRGAYHFAVPDLGSSAQDEARHFLSLLGPLDADDMLVLDYERDWTGDVVGWCKTWLELVRSVTGITPYIYLNLYLSHVYDWGAVERDGGFPLWLADYDGRPDAIVETPWPSLAIKQWTSSGTLPGIAGLVDLNTAFALEEDMASLTVEAFEEWKARFQELFVAPTLSSLDAHAAAINHLLEDDQVHGNAELAVQITKVGQALEEASLKLKQSADNIPQP